MKGEIMSAYPVSLKKDGKFILVTFPDIPEAITSGNNRDHALEMAAEALEWHFFGFFPHYFGPIAESRSRSATCFDLFPC